MQGPIGILGGTFDPVHHGHLRLAIESLHDFALSELRLIPAHTPPHRAPPGASPQQRFEMLRLAAVGAAGLIVDDRELRRGGVSYTVDTVRSLREESGERPLCLIMGMDAFQLLHTWNRWTALLDCVHIIVVNRAGSAVAFQHPEIASLFAERSVPAASVLAASPAGRIFRADMPLLEISAERIRRLLASGEDPRFLLPPAVLDYIRREGLYLSPR